MTRPVEPRSATRDVTAPVRRRALLVGHSFRSANLGVGALSLGSVGLLAAAAKAADVDLELHVYGSSGPLDYRTEAALPIRSEEPISRRALAKALIRGGDWRSYDLILDLSEGDSFASIYGRGRLIDQMLMKATGVASRRPYILGPQTLGPFGRASRPLANAMVRATTATFARDPWSASRFERSRLTTDVAFAVDSGCSAIDDDNGPVGINVSGLLYDGEFGGDVVATAYRRLIGELIEDLRASGREVRLVPHVIASGADGDVGVSHRIANQMGLQVLGHTSPVTAKRQIAELSGFIGSRMHAVIAAVSVGVPAVAIAYSVKFEPLLKALGYEAVETLSPTIRSDDVLRWFEDPAALRAAASRSAAQADQCLAGYRDDLTEILGSLG